jgi:hypothetical protein
MLNASISFCIGIAVAGFYPSAELWNQDGRAIVTDTLPYGNRWGFPFTRDEFMRAALLVHRREDAELFAKLIYEPDPALMGEEEILGVEVADMEMLVLAALSEELAQRVLSYRPRLREQVGLVRRDPEAFLASLPPPGG